MENCIVCGKEIEDFDVCRSCSDFLRCKHPMRYGDKVKEFRKNSKMLASCRTKCSRRKK